MLSLTYEPDPVLTIGDEVITGINILDRLDELRDDDELADVMYKQIATAHLRRQIPWLGFRVEHPDALMPMKRTIDVGYDLTIIDVAKKLTPMTTLYETYVSLDIPVGFYVELVARSSLSKTGYMLANSVGIIDPSYTGTVKVPLIKVDQSMPDLKLPSRAAQLILKPYVVSQGFDASGIEKNITERAEGGFGSTQ